MGLHAEISYKDGKPVAYGTRGSVRLTARIAMAPNFPFLIARRRNEHRRHGNEFLVRLERHTGISHDEVSLIEPARSVNLEERINTQLRERSATNSISRNNHLRVDEAVSLFRQTLELLGASNVDVILCHSPEFSFRCKAFVVARGAQRLVEFDTDITVVVDEESGVAVDYETEATTPLYEVDLWGRLDPRRVH